MQQYRIFHKNQHCCSNFKPSQHAKFFTPQIHRKTSGLEMDKESLEVAKFQAREAARRVRAIKAKEAAQLQEQQRRQAELQLKLHSAKPRRRLSVPENEEAARFSAEQRLLQQERLDKMRRDRYEFEEQKYQQLYSEVEALEENRLRLKELHLQKIRNKKEEQQAAFAKGEEQRRAALRVAQFLRQNSGGAAGAKDVAKLKQPTKSEVAVSGTKEAASRVRDFRRREQEKRALQMALLQQEKQTKRSHHKDNMLRVRQQRAKSCPRTSKSNWSLDSHTLEQKLNEVKLKIEQLRNIAH